MGKLAYICLVTSFVSLIIAVVIVGVTMSGRIIVFGTPPGAIAAGVFGLVSMVSGLAGIVLAILHARTERFSVPSRVCLALNGVYLPESADETRDKERSIIDRGMDKAVTTLVVHFVKRKQLPDAIALLEAMEEASLYNSWKVGERSLNVKELRAELQSATFAAGDQLEASYGSEQIAGYLQGL